MHITGEMLSRTRTPTEISDRTTLYIGTVSHSFYVHYLAEGEGTAVEGLAFEAEVGAAFGEFRKGDVGMAGGIGTDAGVPVEGALPLRLVCLGGVEGLRHLPAERQEGDGGLALPLLLFQHFLVEMTEFKEDNGDFVV